VQRIHPSGEKVPEIRLPDAPAQIVPSETCPGGQLEVVLHLPSLDGFLMASMLPAITDPSILMPHRYQKLLGRVSKTLESLADETDKVPDGAVLRETVGFFSRERRLMDLLQYYRNLLHQA
jgi:hypothetical protein